MILHNTCVELNITNEGLFNLLENRGEFKNLIAQYKKLSYISETDYSDLFRTLREDFIGKYDTVITYYISNKFNQAKLQTEVNMLEIEGYDYNKFEFNYEEIVLKYYPKLDVELLMIKDKFITILQWIRDNITSTSDFKYSKQVVFLAIKILADVYKIY